jgi:3-methyladenine DNA glycosylase AlkD
LTAKEFIERLSPLKSIAELKNVQRFFRDENTKGKFLGIRMSSIFELAKQFTQMPVKEIEKLLQSEYYEARMGAVSIMDFQARNNKIPAERKKELFELYIKRHDRIDNWDLVDRCAPYVVGGYLFDKSRSVLYKLAKSKNVWERRTAIVSTYFFIRQNDISDTFKIAEWLVGDKHDLIQKAVGSWIREAGKKDKQALLQFLETFANSMPSTMLHYAVEKLSKEEKEHYIGIKGQKKTTDR